MGCYHPIRMRYKGLDESGTKQYSFTKMQGQHFSKADLVDLVSSEINVLSKGTDFYMTEDDILIPCRKCIGCRLDYSRRWADRLMLELDHSKTALFFTLTYDDEHVTPAMFDDNTGDFWFTLVKKDLQDFNKRLRYYFPDKEIRFFAAGEYGDQTLRPHYHGIYFGLSLSDFPDSRLLFTSKNHQPIYVSDKLEKIWKNGHVSIGNVSWQSCAYVARYNLKKLSAGNDDFAISRNCIPEFGLMSRNPGIAGYFVDDHPDIFDNPRDKIVIKDSYGVTPVGSVSLPSYLFKKLELVNPELYDIIKQEKIDSSNEKFLYELSNTDLDEFDYLNLKEKLHEKRVGSLVRPL